jgi:hypothetical protein
VVQYNIFHNVSQIDGHQCNRSGSLLNALVSKLPLPFHLADLLDVHLCRFLNKFVHRRKKRECRNVAVVGAESENGSDVAILAENKSIIWASATEQLQDVEL